MIVFETPSPAFDAFIAANTVAWKRILSSRVDQSRRGFVLVELQHNNGSVLMSGILVARYIADVIGAHVMAVVSPTFTRFSVPTKQVERLARSFGIEVVRVVESRKFPSPKAIFCHWIARRRARRVRRVLQTLSCDALRKEVLQLRADDISIGDLIYDSYLDTTGVATFDVFDEKLGREVDRSFRLLTDFRTLFSQHEVRATVVSHTVYVDYGVLTRVSLQQGIPVFGKTGLEPFRARHYTDLMEANQFAGHLDKSQVASILNWYGPDFVEEAKDFFPPRPSTDKRPDFFRLGYGQGKQEVAGRELLRSLGLDERRKTCVIMAHQFTDSVHSCPDILFDDYYQWLDAVLEFTAKIKDVNWLIKQHPYEILLGQTEYFDRLIAKHAPRHQNLRVVPDRIATSSLFSCVNAMTTVNGTSGLEFASAGVPCILAGNPFYGDFDFALRPQTREAYFNILAEFPKLERLSSALVDQAKAVALVEFKYTWVSSSAVPPIGDLGGRQVSQDDLDEFWYDAADRMSVLTIEEDPLYRNIRSMTQNGDKVLLNYELKSELSRDRRAHGLKIP
jgi:hypothetical protein